MMHECNQIKEDLNSSRIRNVLNFGRKLGVIKLQSVDNMILNSLKTDRKISASLHLNKD
jgi:hypothetical protein